MPRIVVLASLLVILTTTTTNARPAQAPKPIPAPESLLRARQACPNTASIVQCRTALVHAYRAIEWSKRIRHRHAASPARVEHLAEFTCIHNGEGAWNANTGNGYFGGLQMDKTFMRTYGADMIAKYHGWANLWSPRDQIIVANRAHHSRGFHPWPNTARACGLIR